MGWQDRLKGDSLSWLLEPADPGVRYLALRHLLDLPVDDPQLQAARAAAQRDGPIGVVLAAQQPEGYWAAPGPGYNPKYRSTVWALILLAQLGARLEQDGRISQACHYLLDQALAPGGQFSTDGAPSGTVDCLQGNLCWALVALGCRDPRLELAFDWLARSVTGEGIAPAQQRQAARRYYAAKCGAGFACGANNRLPCAWGALKVLLALADLPPAYRSSLSEAALRQGVDFLFSVDPAEAAYPSGYAAKPSSNWWKFGFPVFYISDLLQIVEVLAKLGLGAEARLRRALDLVCEKQDGRGRWALEYGYSGKTWVDFGPLKALNKWVTLRALRALKWAESDGTV
jgi:hypothetical protein